MGYQNFEPFMYIPNQVRLTVYGGDASNLPAEMLAKFLNNVEAGKIKVTIGKVFELEETTQAHQYMEDNLAKEKIVVLVN